jgi:hypothetical protein
VRLGSVLAVLGIGGIGLAKLLEQTLSPLFFRSAEGPSPSMYIGRGCPKGCENLYPTHPDEHKALSRHPSSLRYHWAYLCQHNTQVFSSSPAACMRCASNGSTIPPERSSEALSLLFPSPSSSASTPRPKSIPSLSPPPTCGNRACVLRACLKVSPVHFVQTCRRFTSAQTSKVLRGTLNLLKSSGEASTFGSPEDI